MRLSNHASVLAVLQDVQAALQRAKEAADAAAAAEAQRYALLQTTKLQEATQLQQQLEQVCTRPFLLVLCSCRVLAWMSCLASTASCEAVQEVLAA